MQIYVDKINLLEDKARVLKDGDFKEGEEIARTLGISKESARVTATRLSRQGALIRLKRNMYLPAEKWAKIADKIIEKYHAPIILMGDLSENELCLKIAGVRPVCLLK